MGTVNGLCSKKRSEIEIQTETRTAVNFYNGPHIPFARREPLSRFFYDCSQLTELKRYFTVGIIVRTCAAIELQEVDLNAKICFTLNPYYWREIVFQFLINYKITAIVFSLFILYISVISINYIIIIQAENRTMLFVLL